jgi:hypothetical protein
LGISIRECNQRASELGLTGEEYQRRLEQIVLIAQEYENKATEMGLNVDQYKNFLTLYASRFGVTPKEFLDDAVLRRQTIRELDNDCSNITRSRYRECQRAANLNIFLPEL